MADPEPKRRKAEDEAEVDEEEAEEVVEVEDTNITALQDIQRQLDKVNDEASDRVLAVEQEYNKKRRPVYGKRTEIIANVPEFWQRCLLAHHVLVEQITQEDLAIFPFISELDVEDFDDIKSGFRVTIKLKENGYIQDEALSKSYHYGDDGSVTVKPAEIHWKEGHEPGLPGYAAGKRRKANEYMFFAWMASEELQPAGGTPDLIAEALKEEIWPNPLKYYFADDDELAAQYDAAQGEGELLEEVYDDEGEEGLMYDEGEAEDLDGAEEEGLMVEGEEAGYDDEGEELVGEGEEYGGEGEELIEGEEMVGGAEEGAFEEGDEDLGEDDEGAQ